MVNEFVSGFDMDMFLNMNSFRQKILYANEKLKKIASGSARIIYEIDNKTVLKLAKNKKGLAQNGVESDYMLNDWYGDIITGVIESDDDDRWIISNRAKKITKNRFKYLCGVDIDTAYGYWSTLTGRGWKKLSNDIINSLSENEFLNEVADMIQNFDMEIADFNRISSYGEIDGRLVISDYGLTKAVWNEFYNGGRAWKR